MGPGRNDAGDNNRSVGFSPGKLRMHWFDNGVFKRKPWLTTEDTEHTEKESWVCLFLAAEERRRTQKNAEERGMT